MKKIYSVNDSKVVLGTLEGLKSRITTYLPRVYHVITPMLFVAFGLFGVNESAWGNDATIANKGTSVTADGITFSLTGTHRIEWGLERYAYLKSGESFSLGWTVPTGYSISVSQVDIETYNVRSLGTTGKGQYKTKKLGTYTQFCQSNSWGTRTLNSSSYFPLGNGASISIKAVDKEMQYKSIKFYYTKTANSHVITLDNETPTTAGSKSVTLTFDSKEHADITNPQKTNYTFAGWYSGDNGTGSLVIDANGNLQANVDGYTGANGVWKKDATTTLHAKWILNSKTITLDNQSATTAGTTSLTVYYNQNTNLTATPAITVPGRTGYTFEGYYTATNGGGLQLIAKNGNVNASVAGYTDANKKWIYDGDKTLYAYWKQNQTITWNGTLADKIRSNTVTLNATASSGLTVTYSASPSDLVSISGNVVTCLKAGTVTITANQSGNESYNASSNTPQKSFTIVEHAITKNPTATNITYEQALSSSILSGGTANVEGTWSWKYPTTLPAAGTANQVAVFTPSNSLISDEPLECYVSVTVAKATPDILTCSIEDSYMVGDPSLNLSSLWTREGDGAVTYSVTSFTESGSNNGAGTTPAVAADGHTLSLGKAGEVTVQMTIAEGTNYVTKTVTKTFIINKHVTSFTGVAYNGLMVDGTQTANYTYTNTSATKPTANNNDDFYYTVDNVVFANAEKNKGSNLVTLDGKVITACNAGTGKITLHQKETYKYTGAEASYDVKVSKHDNAFSCSWGSWTKQVNFEEVFGVEFTTNNSDYTNSPIEITQTSGETIATLVKNDNTHSTITASYNRGDATWTISQAENYKFKGATKAGVTVKVRVLPAVDCYLFEDNTEHSFSTGITDFSGHYDPAIAVSGPVKQISFDAKKSRIDAISRFIVQYSVDNGNNWRTIDSDINLSTSYKTFGPYDFPNLQASEKVTHIRFGAETGGTYGKSYKNIKISRTTSIKPEDEDGNLVETLTMPQNTVGGSTTSKFYMNFSSCDDVIKVVSNDSHFTVDQSEITVDHTKDYNYAEVTVTYTSDAKGTHTGTITIYTKYQYRTFTVTGTTDRKVQTLDWKPGFTDNPMILPVGLTVDNVNIAAETPSGNSVIYSTNNSEVIKITLGGLGFEVVGEGTAELTASAEGDDDVWFPVSETKTVNATGKKIQVILWEQDLMQGLAPEQVIDLTAKVYIRNMQDGSLTLDEERTNQITYSCPDNTAISLNSAAKQITVLDYGQATITANVEGSENYEAALPVTVYVKVRQPSAGCETPLVLNQTEAVQLFSMNMDLTNWTTPLITSEPIFLDPAKGKPDKLSYQHNGELYVYGLIKLCRGTIKAQQRVNSIWEDIEGSEYNNGGKEGSEGAYDWRLVEDLQLDENADAIRFIRLTAGQGYHNFRNIQITLKQYLRQTNEELDLGDIQIGEARPATIGFDYSDVKGDVWARKANAEDASYVINTSVFEMVCGEHGHKELPITITPTILGPWSATIIIEDQFTHLPCTLTVKANVVTGISYVFNGSEGETGTEWGKNTNWEDNNTPGTNDAVLVNSDVVITGNVTVGSMTISDEATVTVTVTGKLNLGSKNSALLGNYGNLHIEEGGEVNVGSGALLVNDFILDAKLGDADNAAASGQLSDEEQKLIVMNDAYFKMSFDVSGQITYGWYDFVVPFEVDAKNGVFDANGEQIVYGTDYIIMSHSEEKRARNQKAWSTFTGTLEPGRIYTITFEETKTWNTFLFKKMAGSDLANNGSYTSAYSSTIGESQDRGWNGFGNGTLQHRELTDLTGISKVQMYNHTYNRYDVVDDVDWSTKALAVGTAFSIQVLGEQSIVLTEADAEKPLRAPKMDNSRIIEEFYLTLTDSETAKMTDRLWVSASEEATGEYVIGRDLLKMGTPTQAKVAQMWAINNNLTLCDIEMPFVSEQASCALGLFAPKAGSYELMIERAPEDADLYLTYNDQVIWDLTASPYVFDLEKGTTEGYGLRIMARAPQITTGVDETNADSQSVRKVVINDKI